MGRYRIGEVSKHTGLSLRTIRYYEEEGLIASERSAGGQRWYTDQDIVYLKRIIELKGLGFSLSEIRRIIELKAEDESGNKRRSELLAQYRKKLSEDRIKLVMPRLALRKLQLQFALHILQRSASHELTASARSMMDPESILGRRREKNMHSRVR